MQGWGFVGEEEGMDHRALGIGHRTKKKDFQKASAFKQMPCDLFPAFYAQCPMPYALCPILLWAFMHRLPHGLLRKLYRLGNIRRSRNNGVDHRLKSLFLRLRIYAVIPRLCR